MPAVKPEDRITQSDKELHVGLELPRHSARQIYLWAQQQPWPEDTELEQPGEYHITLLYTPEGHDEHKDAWWLEHLEQTEVTINGIKTFPAQEKGYAYVLTIDSDEVTQKAEEMQGRAEGIGLPITHFEGGYKPHITVGYGPSSRLTGIAPPNFQFDVGPSSVSPPRIKESRLAADEAQMMYHVSPMTNRDSIMRDGLRQSGVDGMHVWVFPELSSAQGMATRLWNGSRQNDIWQVDTHGMEVGPDPHGWQFGRAVQQPIGPERLSLHSTPDVIPEYIPGNSQRPDELQRRNQMAERVASKAPEPPNYRHHEKASEKCSTCKMFFKGHCWGFGNKEVSPEAVCNDWYPEHKRSAYNPDDISGTVILDHLSLQNVAANLHYKFAEGGMDAAQATDYAKRMLKLIGYPPDDITVQAALQAWQQVYPNDRLVESPSNQIQAPPSTPQESWGYGTKSKVASPEPQVMYHVAPAEAEQSIAQHGLLPTAPGSEQSYAESVGDPAAVWLYHEQPTQRDDDRWTPSLEHVWEVNTSGLPLEYDSWRDAYTSQQPIPSERVRRIAAAGNIPPEPGTAPIPEGNIRLYHYTGADPEQVRQQGLLMSQAKGETYGEPNQIWGSARPPSFDNHNVVEFSVPRDDPRWDIGKYEPYINYAHPEGDSRTDPNFDYGQYLHARNAHVTFNGDIRPEEIHAVHEPWHQSYRYLMQNYPTPDADPNQFDWALDPDTGDPQLGRAVQAWKNSLWPKQAKLAWQSEAAIPLDQIAYIAEGAMERGGMTGRQWHVPQGEVKAYRDQQSGLRLHPVEEQMTAFVQQVTGDGHIIVRATNWFDGTDTASGSTDLLNSINVRYDTNDLVLLHECAHVMRKDHGHDPQWMTIAHQLYRQYLGEEAGQTFWNLVEPYVSGQDSPSGDGPEKFAHSSGELCYSLPDSFNHIGALSTQQPLYHWLDASQIHDWMDAAHTGPGQTFLTETGDDPGVNWNDDIPHFDNPVRLTIDPERLDSKLLDQTYEGWLGNHLYQGPIPHDAVIDIKGFKQPDSWDEDFSTVPSQVNNPEDHWGDGTDPSKRVHDVEFSNDWNYRDSKTAGFKEFLQDWAVKRFGPESVHSELAAESVNQAIKEYEESLSQPSPWDWQSVA